MKKLKMVSILLSLVVLFACSDVNEYITEIGKCRLVSHFMGDKQAVIQIDKKMANYMFKHQYELAFNHQYGLNENIDFKSMAYKHSEELGLDNPDSIFTKFRLVKTYNQCEDLHEQPKKSAPSFFYYIVYPFL